MSTKKDLTYKYFLYSDEQIAEKNKILSAAGKQFVPGTVIIKGKRQKFTQISDIPTIPRYFDTKVIAEGNLSDFTYTEPKNERRSGN